MTPADSADVIVIGGGGAGLAAAVSAAEAGARVILLERTSRLGGTTSMSMGLITAANTRAQKRVGVTGDDAADHLADINGIASPEQERNNPALRALMVRELGATVDWLEGHGVVFGGPIAQAPHRKPRMLVALPSARSYALYLEWAARRLGVDIRCNSAVTDLIVDEGRATGVVCGAQTYRARRGIILASGDYTANTRLRAAWLPRLDGMDAVNPDSVGTVFEIAMAHGGRVLNEDIVRAGQLRLKPPTTKPHWLTRLPTLRPITMLMRFGMRHLPRRILKPFVMPFLAGYLAPERSLFEKGAILVNADGERFTDELGPSGRDIVRQPDKRAYIVFDQAIGQQFDAAPNHISTAPGVAYAYLRDYLRYRPDVCVSATSLDELATLIGVDAKTLTKSASVATSGRPQLGHGPYYAIGPVYSVLTTTMGGLAINENLEVLGEGDMPIKGLLAAGSVGYGGMVIVGHGHNLGWAFTSGRLAGLNAARQN